MMAFPEPRVHGGCDPQWDPRGAAPQNYGKRWGVRILSPNTIQSVCLSALSLHVCKRKGRSFLPNLSLIEPLNTSVQAFKGTGLDGRNLRVKIWILYQLWVALDKIPSAL